MSEDDFPQEFVDSGPGMLGLPPARDSEQIPTEPFEAPDDTDDIPPFLRRRIAPDGYAHSASRTLLCPYCATVLDNWRGLPIVDKDGAPVRVRFKGDTVPVTPSLLQNPVTELQWQVGRLRAYRQCPNSHPLPLEYGKRPVLMLPVLGPSQAGKTMFLSALHHLIMHGAFSRMGWHITLEDAPGVSAYARELEKYYASGAVEKTLGDDNVLIYRFYGTDREGARSIDGGFNIVMFDLPGERYIESPDNDPRVIQVSIADGLLFVVDSAHLNNDDTSNDYAQMLNRLSNQLDDDHPYFRMSDRSAKWQCVPLAVAIAKSDRIATQLNPLYSRVTDGAQYVHGEVNEASLDEYCAAFLHDAGGDVGDVVLARVLEQFIYSSWAFVSSFDEARSRTQAINTLYVFSRLIRHVVGMVNVVEARYVAR